MSDFFGWSVFFGLYGGIGSRKTGWLLSASEHWKDAKTPASLDDLFVFVADKDGLAYYQANGILVPHLDMWECMTNPDKWRELGLTSPPSVSDLINKFVSLAETRVKKGQTSIIVIDTLSLLGQTMEIELRETGASTGGRQNHNVKAVYGELAFNLSRLAYRLARIRVPILAGMHVHTQSIDDEAGIAKELNTGIGTALQKTTKGGMTSSLLTSEAKTFAVTASIAGQKGHAFWKAMFSANFFIEPCSQGSRLYTQHPTCEVKCRYVLQPHYINGKLADILTTCREQATKKGDQTASTSATTNENKQ